MKKFNAASRVAVEAAAKIEASVNIQGEKIERAEADTRAKVDAKIWEKAEKTRNAKAKAEAETVERARA